MDSAPTATEAPRIARDIRLDRIGCVDELVKRFADPLRKQVKFDMAGHAVVRAQGDAFAALLVDGGSTQTVNPDKFLRLFERGTLTRSQYLACVTVKKDAALDCLSRNDLDRISTFAPRASALTVSRIKGVEIELVDAVKAIAAAIA